MTAEFGLKLMRYSHESLVARLPQYANYWRVVRSLEREGTQNIDGSPEAASRTASMWKRAQALDPEDLLFGTAIPHVQLPCEAWDARADTEKAKDAANAERENLPVK